jgi:hypothetical protein
MIIVQKPTLRRDLLPEAVMAAIGILVIAMGETEAVVADVK